MKYKAYSDTETGWMLNCQVKDSAPNSPVDGGLIMNNITHQGHRFADEVRVIGFWLEWKERTYPVGQPNVKPVKIEIKSEFFTLSREFFDMSDIEEMFPSAEKAKIWGLEWDAFRKSGSALGFGHFPFYFGLRVVCRSKPGIFAHIPNLDKGGLEVKQTTLFSKYANMPPHEPSGGLTAARFHPMTTTKFADNAVYDAQAVVRSEVVSIRYDYYLHLNLDRNHDVVKNFGMEQLGNQAGVFKDEDKLNVFGAISEPLSNRRPGGGLVFAAVEKPLVLEICAMGLENGFPYTAMGNSLFSTWDNIHWWGKKRGEFPSTPGGFHAAHLHWRWGTSTHAAPYGAEPQFYKSGVPKEHLVTAYGYELREVHSPLGALVDPNCWIQTIWFGIAEIREQEVLSSRSPAAPNRRSQLEFIDRFKAYGPPRLIYENEIPTAKPLALWLSVTVSSKRTFKRTFPEYHPGEDTFTQITENQEIRSEMNGTLFVNGIFFAHEAENMDLLALAVGSRKPMHWPKSIEQVSKSASWERY